MYVHESIFDKNLWTGRSDIAGNPNHYRDWDIFKI